jgi:hypothetical protein
MLTDVRAHPDAGRPVSTFGKVFSSHAVSGAKPTFLTDQLSEITIRSPRIFSMEAVPEVLQSELRGIVESIARFG